MAVENEKEEWLNDPFKLSGLNGYLYGRGTSDNKGPIVSTLIAVHELFRDCLLDVNVIFLIEGEEECGSNGFLEAITNHQDLFEDIDLILLSNSYWLGEDTPCITYGLRGVVRADITVNIRIYKSLNICMMDLFIFANRYLMVYLICILV